VNVRFGAAYYHEYQPHDRLDTDLDLMAAAHFSVIRVGESVWSTWEPRNGVFDLEWLTPVLDGAHARGIGVILGTPTYAVPPWLVRQYPELAGERRTGQRIDWGARQEVDFTHPGFRFHAERLIRRILERHADHPAVIGFQVDNEPGNELLHNRGVFERFVDDLRARYGEVETLNRAWGLVYWSHRLSTWADLWRPDGNVQPSYDVAWRRFQAAQTTEFIAWQAGIVRQYRRPEQFITTCIAYERPAVDDHRLTEALDVTAGNLYYLMQDGLQRPDGSEPAQYWTSTGTWALYQSADRIYSSRQEPFLVTETNAMHIGFPWDSRPAYDGQWRQVAWALVARGARMVSYWHWHTLHFGAETYWGGVLPHSGEPGRTYHELAAIGAELDRAGDALAGLVPDADLAIVWSNPSKWLMEKYPPLMTADGGPDARAYQGLLNPFYRGAFDTGRQVRIVHAEQLTALDPAGAVRLHRVVVVSGLYLADDATLDWLVAYAEAGGHLVLGPRTGYGDPEGRARAEVAPARLREAAGVRYDEFSNLTAALPVTSAVFGDGGHATRWVDGLRADGAEILARYEHPHFGRWPAVTTRAHGGGRVTCVGTLPDQTFGAALMRWLVPEPVSGWPDLPPSVTVTTATAPDGRRLHVVHNWSFTPVQVCVPAVGDLRDLLADGNPTTTALDLNPWDVRVLF
jgi:beta-galactosidase